MTKEVDEIFKESIERDDSLDVLLGSDYGDIIDLVSENVHTESIFDNEAKGVEPCL